MARWAWIVVLAALAGCGSGEKSAPSNPDSTSDQADSSVVAPDTSQVEPQ
jgi:uncharacterized lipoprotein YmbA